MKFSRSRTQVLYRYVPGALFEHDKFGICLVTDVAINAPDNLNVDGLKHALRGYLTHWDGYGADAFPDPFDEWGEYRVGIPDRVTFMPFPSIVECSQCGYIDSLEDLTNEPLGKPTVCTHCGKGKYRQLPYITIHNCGKLTSIPVVTCPEHGKQHMHFVDTGRFVTALWRCEICGYTRGMPRYQCQCSYSRTEAAAHDNFKKNMQYVRTNDTSVLYSHTIPIVNLAESVTTKLQNDPRATGLILARIYDLINRNIFEVVDERSAAANQPALNAQAKALVEQLLQSNPDSAEAKKLAAMYGGSSRLPEDEKIDIVVNSLPSLSQLPPSQSIVEHVAIVDGLDLITPQNAYDNALQRGDETGAYDFEEGFEFGKRVLGFKWIGCITDFPIALISIGYTRGSKLPGEAMLNPFRTSRYDSEKVPLYAITSNTEGIMIQIDPQRIIRWLLDNELVIGKMPQSEIDSWFWIQQNLPNLSKFRGLANAPDDLSSAEKAVLTLIHTISHLLMKQIEWSGFDPESVSEYILPASLSFIIHSNNYSSFTIGGMVTLYEQRLHGWLRETFNAAYNCIYNPICQDEGGSCAGCLHRQYNCEGFNALLSRSVLQGGSAPELSSVIKRGFWTNE